jgi:hypothetical protein
MWVDWTLVMHVDHLVGGIPKHPELVRRWQEAKWPTNPDRALALDDPQTPEEAALLTIAELGTQALASEDVAGVWTGFAEHDGRLVLEERNVKAALKESSNIVKGLPSMRVTARDGVTIKDLPLRSKLAERVFVRPRWLDLGVSEPTGSMEKPIHVMTRQGPRTALKRADYIDDVTITCTLRVLNDGMITEKILRTILDHVSENGLGTDRSQGAGCLSYQLTLKEM